MPPSTCPPPHTVVAPLRVIFPSLLLRKYTLPTLDCVKTVWEGEVPLEILPPPFLHWTIPLSNMISPVVVAPNAFVENDWMKSCFNLLFRAPVFDSPARDPPLGLPPFLFLSSFFFSWAKRRTGGNGPPFGSRTRAWFFFPYELAPTD